MATVQLSGVIQHLRRAMLVRDTAGLTDQQLLEDYISGRNQAALAALVQRHGPMVWGVCRRVLTNYHDAEDAFQATFLVLVRRATSIASPALLANWLYGVAHQTAIKARATVAKRKMRERQVTEMLEPAGVEQNFWIDMQPLLDQELSRLPDKYRGVIILCDLEGKTRKEVAEQLGWPEGTVASRLARARNMLAKRLTQRGVALSCAALAAVLAQQAAAAGVPYVVVDSTIRVACLLAAGKAAATGAISVKVAALTEGVMKAMLFSKLKTAIAIVLILGFVATGATILTCRTAAGQDDKKPAAEKPVAPAAKSEKEKEVPPASGVNLIMNKSAQKELNLTADQMKDLQAGLDKVRKKYDEQLEKIPVVRPGDPRRPGAVAEMPDPKMVAELVNKTDAETKKLLAEVLTPKQLSRLKQIDLQLEGIRALHNQEVALALKLTDDQKGKVKKLFEDISHAAMAHALSVAPPDPSGVDQLNETVRETRNKALVEGWNKAFQEATGKIPSLLTPEQRRKWEAMTGAPFQLEPVDAPKDRPADDPKLKKEPAPAKEKQPGNDTKLGFIKVEARGDLVRKGADYFLVVKQPGFKVVELLVRSNADRSPVNKVLQSYKDCAVVLTGNLSWLPKGAQVNSDDDYALGIVVSAEAQLRRVSVLDTTAPYVQFEARGDPWSIDNSLYVRVQLQEKPAKKVTVFGQIGNLGQLMAVLPKLNQATVAGYVTWEPKPSDEYAFRLPFIDIDNLDRPPPPAEKK
jgi:RNA polymerase sigma factor (sigma-70 family)